MTPTVVLLPGLDGGLAVLDRLAERLDGPVVTLGLPDDPTLDRLDAIAAVLAPQLPAGPHVVFGASLGGLVGRALASRPGSDVRGLVTLGTLPSPERRPPAVCRQARSARWLPPAAFGFLWRQRLERRLTAEGIDPVSRARLLRDLPVRDVVLARLRAICAWADAPPLPCPTVWLAGQTDLEAPWTPGHARADLPGAAVVVVPGGHRAHWTQPSPVVEAITGLRAQVRRSGAGATR